MSQDHETTTSSATTAPIAIVAVDLDGTILEQGRTIRPALLDRFAALAQRDVRCVTATGRPFAFQLDVFAAHGIAAPSGLFSALIADEREIFLLDGPAGYMPHGSWNDELRRRWHALHPLAVEVLEAATEECRRRGWDCQPHHSDAEAFERGLPTIYLAEASQSRSICEWVQDRIQERGYPLAANRNVRIVQVHDVIAGKGAVLAELSRILGVGPGQVLAIGDSSNDISMLDGAFGFRPATVENADDQVKEIVQAQGGYLASARSGLGVIEILDRLFPD